MKRKMQIVVAIAGLSAALTFAFVVAFWSHVRNLPESPPTINRQLPRIEIQAPIIDGRYVATTIDHSKQNKGRRVYHIVQTPLCTYAERIEHRLTFDSPEEAEAAGYEPCSRCLPRQIARVK